MRVIKFRAWDKKEERFVHFELFKGANRRTPDIYDWADLHDWQQFTGLHDADGREIWEGDVLHGYFANGLGSHQEATGTVFFNTERAEFAVDIQTHPDKQWSIPLNVVVIGNMYQKGNA